MPRIFISYRRDDSAAHTGRIYDRLEGEFGHDQVFMDVSAIRPGLNFVEVVEQAVGVCDALVAVIGREWLTASDPSGSGGRRLEDPADLVRLEIGTALRRDIRVIPVLVQGAQMPPAVDLPEDLKELVHRNALEVSDNRFRTDIDQLIKALEAPATEVLTDSVFVESAQLSDGGFVGREREMADLKVALEDAMAGRGRLVMLVGEPGIGKTRTAQELTSLAERRGALVLWGRIREEPGAPPYWPWIQIIRAYVEQHDSDTLRSQMGPGASAIVEIVAEAREKLPAIPIAPQIDDPEAARFRLFESITTFLTRATQEQSLVLVMDNLHWADASSLRLLEFMAQDMQNSKMLIVGTYRDVDISRGHPLYHALGELGRQRIFTRIPVRGLEEEEVGEMIQVAGSIRPPPELVTLVHQQTEGNPLFVLEVIRLLDEEGMLEPGRLADMRLWQFRVPEGIREVIGRRLDRLSPACNEVLKVASVIGREFSLGVLDRLADNNSANIGLGITQQHLLAALEEALAVKVIEEPLQAAVGCYQFAHALIQQTLSSELSLTRRVQLHASIAGALEEAYGPEADRHAAELAHHFGEAQTLLGKEKLVRYSLLAGERALASYAHEEASTQFEKALVAKEGSSTDREGATDAETAAILFGLGHAQIALNRHQDAVFSLGRAFDYYAQSGEVDRALAIAQYPHSVSLIGGMREIISRAIQLAPSNSLESGRVLSSHGYCLGLTGRGYESAQEAFDQALVIARTNNDTALEMRVLASSANIDGFHLRWETCLANSLHALQLAPSVEDSYSKLRAHLWAILSLLSAKGDIERARCHAVELRSTAERLRDAVWLPRSFFYETGLFCVAGRWPFARQLSDQGLALFPADPALLGQRALLEHQMGDVTQGDAYLQRFLDSWGAMMGRLDDESSKGILLAQISYITGNGDLFDIVKDDTESLTSSFFNHPFAVFLGRCGLILMAVQHGDVSLLDNLYNALAPHRVTFAPRTDLAVDRLLGLSAHTMGDLDKAAEHFEDAMAFCSKAGYRPELAWTCCDYADTLLQRNEAGDREKAMSLLDESLAISNELGMRPLMERVLYRRDKQKA